MRFREFEIKEDIGLPTEKSVTSTAGSYRPGSDKKVWGTGSTAKNIPGPLDDVRPGNTDKKVWGTGSTAKQPYSVDSPAKSAKPTYDLKNDPLGKANAGEPPIGQSFSDKSKSTATPSKSITPTATQSAPAMSTADRFRQVDTGNIKPNITPTSTINPGMSAPRTTVPGANLGSKAALKSAGKKMLGKVIPGVGTAMDAANAYDRYQNKDYTGAAISGAGALAGLVPGIGAPLSWGAAGINAIRDRLPSTETPPPAQQQPAPVTKTQNPNIKPVSMQQAPAAQQQPAQPRTLKEPVVPTQPRQSYAGTAGAQAIQRANPDVIKNVNDITAGDTINLPGGGQYTIKPGDTLDKIAQNQSTTSAPTITPRLPVTQTQLSNTPTTTSDNSSDDTFRNQNLERMKNQADQASTTVVPTTKQDASSVQAEEANPLRRIKSLAGLR